MKIIKQSNVAAAAVGDKILYTITVSNDASYPIENVVISDTLAQELNFVEGTLEVNGNPIAGDIISGVKLGSLLPDLAQTQVIKFYAELVGQGIGMISNISFGTYSYKDPSTGLIQFGSVESLPNEITVYNIHLEMIKQQDKNKATLGETVNYTITLYNDGDVELINVLVKDVINPALELVDGSIRLDNKPIHLSDLGQGINIPVIGSDCTVILSFAVVVKGGSSRECIMNVATATATYVLPNRAVGTRRFCSNKLQLTIGIKCFKQMNLTKSLMIPCMKPDVEEINDIHAMIDIIDTYTIATPVGTSNEGQILTGNKLVVNGIARLDISYTALVTTQSVHVAHYDIPFSTFLVLPLDYQANRNVGVKGIVENVHYQLDSTRKIYINIAMIVTGLIIPLNAK